jgi:hypothetical protein
LEFRFTQDDAEVQSGLAKNVASDSKYYSINFLSNERASLFEANFGTFAPAAIDNVYLMERDTQTQYRRNLRWKNASLNGALCAYIDCLSAQPLHTITAVLNTSSY